MSSPWTNQAVSLIVLTEQQTGFSGIFGYSPTVGHGNLIFSLSAAAGTDPYGNTYPQGISLGSGGFTGIDFNITNSGGLFVYSGTPANGNLIGSWAGISGTDAFGNSYPQGINVTQGAISGTSITSSTFDGNDFILNGSGLFVYSSTPASGNLIGSIASTGGTDGFGNTFQGGITTYDNSNGSYVQVSGELINFFATGMFQTQQLLATGNAIFQVTSGLQSNTDISANVICQSAQANDGSNSLITLSAAITDVVNALNVGSNLAVSGTGLVDGTLTVGNGSTSSLVFNPKMGTPTNYPLSTSVPTDTNSGTGWVSGERAFMNNNWVAAINNISACLNSLISEMQNRGMVN